MIEWRPDYLTGIEEIDLQHQYFAKLINRIEAKITAPGTTRTLGPLLTELTYYARFHFLSEENMMAESGYPDLEEHKQLHFDLIERLCNSIHMLEEEIVKPVHIVDMLGSWFIDHTLVEDRKYAHFVGCTPEQPTAH